MRYRVQHRTSYTYSDDVLLGQNTAHIKPRDGGRQRRESYTFQVEPEPAFISEHIDCFGNDVAVFAVQQRHRSLKVFAESIVDVQPFSPPMPGLTAPWEDVRDTLAAENAQAHFDALHYLNDSVLIQPNSETGAYALESFTPHRPILEAALDLTRRIHSDFKYDPRATNLQTSVSEVFRLRRGVCQDFAHLELSCLRALGLAGRYVSGYLLTLAPPDRERLVGADASHAWLSIYCADLGWIDLDPTNNLVPSDKHVVVAFGRDYADVSPIRGVILGGGRHALHVGVDVTPV